MTLFDQFKNKLGPVSDDVKGCICVVKQGHIEDTAVLSDKVLKTDPVVVNSFVYYVDITL